MKIEIMFKHYEQHSENKCTIKNKGVWWYLSHEIIILTKQLICLDWGWNFDCHKSYIATVGPRLSKHLCATSMLKVFR